MNIQILAIIILAYIVIIGTLNDRLFHIQSDIALIFFSSLLSIALLILRAFFPAEPLQEALGKLGGFGFHEYLMDGMLCFMLFSGASKVNMRKFRTNLQPIFLLAFLTTVISSFLYGGLLYLVALVFYLPLDFWTCVLLGCVVSPTDPIAATGILNKIGLSKNVCSVIENESLFNDGTGVTLFIFVRSIVMRSGQSNIVVLLVKEIFGAAAVALIISFLLFQLVKISRDPIRYILISLLDVSLVYVICEHLGFSGVLASVICGFFFSYNMDKIRHLVAVVDPHGFYHDFWEIIESILNSVLFVMIGFVVLGVTVSPYLFVLVPAALLALIISRAIGVSVSTVMNRNNIPGNYNLPEYVILMTWSALKGGLSLALAVETEAYLPTQTYIIFLNVAFISIFFTVLVQGQTVRRVYYALEDHKAKRKMKANKLSGGDTV
ncbi:MAG: sodium:proton antiporter [Lachnospiraceae bacterium]|nr:sodium:proton antiporter [Lachnospiraceae bacterium]